MTQGQFTGPRGSFLYTSDAGKQYVLTLDNTLGTVVGNGLTPATTSNANAAQSKPQRFKPRGVHWQSTDALQPGRKFLVCGSALSALYAEDVSVEVTIDNVVGVTTGRRGEQFSFPKLSSVSIVPTPSPSSPTSVQ